MSSFQVTDTSQRGWSDLSLQREYCAAIEKYNPHVIFTHSMGNNIIAAAIGNRIGACTRISQTVRPNSIQWFSSQAPWLGSPAADATTKACQGGATKPLDKIRQEITKAVAPCLREPATRSLTTDYNNPSSPTIQPATLRSIGQQYTSGALCGVSATPLTLKEAFSVNGAGLWALSKFGQLSTLVNWGVDAKSKLSSPFSGNDGLVTWSSCKLPGFDYATSPSSAYYVSALSHEDGTCFVADRASLGSMKQPCAWFAARVQQARKALGLTASKSLNVATITPTAAPAYQSLIQISAATDSEDDMSHLESASEITTDSSVDSSSEAAAEAAHAAWAEQQTMIAAAVAGEAQATAEMYQQIAEDAKAELVDQGLIEGPHHESDRSLAEMEVDVIMALQHQQSLEEKMEKDQMELEAQLQAENLLD